MTKPTYVFFRGERGVFAEVYFPKKVAFQGTIFTALEEGHEEENVKIYLKKKVNTLLKELAEYPVDIFDPYRYGTLKKPNKPESTVAKVRKRINMYSSPFKGWSMYEVDGVFFKRGRADEERTQVIRLMFRFRSPHIRLARRWDCEDVLRAILYFVIETRGFLSGGTAWSKEAKQQFFARHEWDSAAKKEFAERNFTRIAQRTLKWIDDCILFIFPYLVRNFSDKVLETRRLEDEIWVTSFFDLTLNVIRKSKKQTMILERKEIL